MSWSLHHHLVVALAAQRHPAAHGGSVDHPTSAIDLARVLQVTLGRCVSALERERTRTAASGVASTRTPCPRGSESASSHGFRSMQQFNERLRAGAAPRGAGRDQPAHRFQQSGAKQSRRCRHTRQLRSLPTSARRVRLALCRRPGARLHVRGCGDDGRGRAASQHRPARGAGAHTADQRSESQARFRDTFERAAVAWLMSHWTGAFLRVISSCAMWSAIRARAAVEDRSNISIRRTRRRSGFLRALAGREISSYSSEKRCICKGGRWYGSAVTAPDPDGDGARLLHRGIEYPKRKEVEAALHANEECCGSRVATNQGCSTLICDLEGGFEPCVLGMLGYSEQSYPRRRDPRTQASRGSAAPGGIYQSTPGRAHSHREELRLRTRRGKDLGGLDRQW